MTGSEGILITSIPQFPLPPGYFLGCHLGRHLSQPKPVTWPPPSQRSLLTPCLLTALQGTQLNAAASLTACSLNRRHRDKWTRREKGHSLSPPGATRTTSGEPLAGNLHPATTSDLAADLQVRDLGLRSSMMGGRDLTKSRPLSAEMGPGPGGQGALWQR